MEESIKFPSEIVLDASTVLNFLMPDENTPSEVDLLFEQINLQNVKARAPEILNYEVANSLRSAVISKRTNSRIALSIFEDFLSLEIGIQSVSYLDTLNIAIKKGLSVYDASYVYLANTLNCMLITSDENMSKAVKRAFYFDLRALN